MKSIFAYIILLITCSTSVGQDFSAIENVAKDRPTVPVILSQEDVPKPVPEKDIYPVDFKHIPSKSSPKWNLEGSWSRIKIKSELVKHLVDHSNHKNKFAKKDLEKLTIKQLWWVHDNDHDGKKVFLTKREGSKVPLTKTKPYCPPGSS
jgi:hypothetical protein